jgi:hypothetical protein
MNQTSHHREPNAVSIIEFFSPPNGDFLTSPDMAWLKHLVLKEGPDYWNAGAGQAAIWFGKGKRRPELDLTFDKSFGFSLQHIDAKSVHYVSLGKGDFAHAVTVYVCGDPLVLPSAFFIPRRLAWIAVEEFCRTGLRSANIRWGKRSEQNWHYGHPEDG